MSRSRREPQQSQPFAPSALPQRAGIHAAMQFLLAMIVYRFAASVRLMDADEGHFLSAVRSVYNGLNPFQDFFFQQTPLFPYPYALAMRIFGYGYEQCLWVSILCGAGLAVVTAAFYARGGRSAWFGWIGWWMVVANAQTFFWTPMVKNHALPLFCGATALWAASRRCESARPAFGWGALSGFAAIWCVGSRLPALPLSAAAALWIVGRAVWPGRPRGAWMSVAGFAVGAMPPLLLALRSLYPDPWRAWFDVVEFHRSRSAGGTYGDWNTISVELIVLARQAQFPFMLLIALIAVFAALMSPPAAVEGSSSPSSPSSRGEARVALYLALFGIAAAVWSLLPRQTFHQYFMVPLVLFWFAALPLWRFLLRAEPRRVLRGLGVLLLACYAFGVTNHQERIFPDCWGRGPVERMSAALAAHTSPQDEVLSTWQGFTFMAQRRDLPGNENFNARTIADKITAEEARRVRIASNSDLAAVVLAAKPRAIVTGFFSGPTNYPGVPPIFYRWLYLPVRGRDGVPRMQMRAEITRNYHKVDVPDQDYHELWVRNQ